MDKRQRNTLNALERILVFVSSDPLPPPLTGATEGLTDQVTALRSTIAKVHTYAMNQGSGQTYRITEQRKSLRRQLRYQHLQPIRTIGRVLEKDIPGMPKLVNLRKSVSSEQSLIAVAKATHRDVAAYRELFVARGLPSDFLQLLDEKILALEEEKSRHSDFLAQKVAARTGIRDSLKQGMHIRECLAVIIQRCCAVDTPHAASTLTISKPQSPNADTAFYNDTSVTSVRRHFNPSSSRSPSIIHQLHETRQDHRHLSFRTWSADSSMA